MKPTIGVASTLIPLALMTLGGCVSDETQEATKTAELVRGEGQGPESELNFVSNDDQSLAKLSFGFDMGKDYAAASVIGLGLKVEIARASGEVVFSREQSWDTTSKSWRPERRLYSLSNLRVNGVQYARPLKTRSDEEGITRHWGGGITERYEHRAFGLKHSLVVDAPVDERQMLRASYDTSTLLALKSDEGRLVYSDENGDVFEWSGLIVKDATGKVLDASFGVEGGVLTFEVDTLGAEYPIEIDPLATSMPKTTLEGTVATERLGRQVINAGDVNNDGVDDLLVGQSSFSDLFTSEGRVQVFLGNATTGLSNTSAFTAVGGQEFGTFGSSIGGGGDVDNDGFDDFVVGGVFATDPSNAAAASGGRVVLFQGTDAIMALSLIHI